MWSDSFAKIKNLSCDINFLNAATQEIKILCGQNNVSIWQPSDDFIKFVSGDQLSSEEEFSAKYNSYIFSTIETIQSCVSYNLKPNTQWPGDCIVKKCALYPWVHLGKIVALVIITSNDDGQFPITLEQIPTLLLNTSDKIHESIVNISQHKTDYISYSGIPCSPGLSVCKAVVIKPMVELDDIIITKTNNIDREIANLADAIHAVKQDMQTLTQAITNKDNNTEIINAYMQMMDRHGLMRDIAICIKQDNIDACSGLKKVIQSSLNKFQRMKDPYLRARASDVRDIGQRILAYLQSKAKENINYPDKFILVGNEISMLDIASTPISQLCGVIAINGSKYSHASIFARSLGVPVVMGVSELSLPRCENSLLFIDGYSGKIIINPAKKQLEKIHKKIDTSQSLIEEMAKLRFEAAKTSDDYAVSLYVNVGDVDIQSTLSSSPEGIGLFRSEVSFLQLKYFPNTDSQILFYKKLLQALSPKPVIIRTLDVGGDKQLSYCQYEEENPYLGWRGMRFSLAHPEIFQEQIKAMILASSGLNNLHIMLPMISTLAEIKLANKYIKNAFAVCSESNANLTMPAIGIMLETPAAIMQIKDFAKMVDFFSVGTNDLTQYMMAVDRNNSKVCNLFDSFNPAILKTLQKVVDDAHAVNKHISICGEFASDPMAAILLVAMGFDALSMSPASLDKVKWSLSKFSLANCQQLLKECLLCADADSVNALLTQAFKDNDLGQLAGILER